MTIFQGGPAGRTRVSTDAPVFATIEAFFRRTLVPA
jgi:hypothetical protein